jgi:signal transduction histidine kinase
LSRSHPGRRSWFSLLFGTKPNRFGRLLILFFIVVAAQAMVCLQIFHNTIKQIQLLDTPKPDAAVDIMVQLTDLGWFFALTIVALCVVCMYLIYHITVNVMGAKLAILKYIEQLKSGNYESFRSLRGDDEFKDVLSSLEDLAARLKRETKKN